jgi:predicted NBD/HSP70 family sugar kinase
MYVGIDIGGTKTLVAKLSDDGQITDSRRFPSNHNYGQFLRDLGANLKELQLDGDFRCCAGVSGLLDRRAGTVHALGNLPWQDVAIRDDISGLIGGQPVIIENDSRLAGLSEAQLVKDTYNDILFLTVSTGIGGAFVQNGRIAKALQDTEMGKMPLWHGGEYVHWEEFAGGRGVVNRFHKQAIEITDPAEWREIGTNLAHGLGAVCSVLQPEVIILGGSVGKHADKYSGTILEFLARHLHPVVRQPEAILAAQRPDEAVIYGCYDLAKQIQGGGPADG